MMQIGDRVRVIGMVDGNGKPYINKNDKCLGAVGKIVRGSTVTDWLVVFDTPVHYEGNKYWEDMPFLEKELELI